MLGVLALGRAWRGETGACVCCCSDAIILTSIWRRVRCLLSFVTHAVMALVIKRASRCINRGAAVGDIKHLGAPYSGVPFIINRILQSAKGGR